MILPTILTIAGSDSGGGAGIQADLKTFTVLGCYGSSVICALTAQNGFGVRGMLFSASIIETVACHLRDKAFPLVVDPVAVSQTGHALLEESAVDALVRLMLPLADLLTPNRPEAEKLCAMAINSPEDIAVAGRKLLAMGASAVLIKGGHFEESGSVMTDWLCLPEEDPKPLRHARIDTPNNHGTGCALSAAIASFLGKGHTLEQAVTNAQAYLTAALAGSFNPGGGTGPVNFLAGARAIGSLE